MKTNTKELVQIVGIYLIIIFVVVQIVVGTVFLWKWALS